MTDVLKFYYSQPSWFFWINPHWKKP